MIERKNLCVEKWSNIVVKVYLFVSDSRVYVRRSTWKPGDLRVYKEVI